MSGSAEDEVTADSGAALEDEVTDEYKRSHIVFTEGVIHPRYGFYRSPLTQILYNVSKPAAGELYHSFRPANQACSIV